MTSVWIFFRDLSELRQGGTREAKRERGALRSDAFREVITSVDSGGAIKVSSFEKYEDVILISIINSLYNCHALPVAKSQSFVYFLQRNLSQHSHPTKRSYSLCDEVRHRFLLVVNEFSDALVVDVNCCFIFP